MRRLPRSIGIVACVGAAALLVAACGSSSSSSSKASASSTTNAVNIASGTGNKVCNAKIALITHGDNGSFWSVVYKGAKDAAADLGCTLTEVYGSQQQGQAQPDDNAENAQIQNAINAKVNGIAVSDHDPALMNPTLAKAAAAGIPVVLLNAGCDDADIAASKALTCVGQPEQLAGSAAGLAFKQAGATNVLCIIHQSGQNLLDRCNGIAQALGVGQQCKRERPVERACVHRADAVDAERGIEPAAGDRTGHLLPAGPYGGQRGDGAQQRDRYRAGDQ